MTTTTREATAGAACEVSLEGAALHSGAHARVVLRRKPGPIAFRRGAERARLDELVVVDTTRATTVATRSGAMRIATIEHLTSALAGAGVHAGVEIEVDGPELPILDGRAELWAKAIARLGVAPSEPSLEIARDDEIEAGRSRMILARGPSIVAVETTFGDPRLDAEASWSHDPVEYVAGVAPARTFAFEHEIAGMLERGLARHAPAEGVVVIGAHAIHAHGRPFSRSEPVRHKLLDLIGDLFVYGGPPRGQLRVIRPGHAANHALVARAIERGSLVRRA